MALPAPDISLVTKGRKKNKGITPVVQNTAEDEPVNQKQQSMIDFIKKVNGMKNITAKLNILDEIVDLKNHILTGDYVFDYLINRKGMPHPTKMLLYGREHTGKTTYANMLGSRILSRNLDSNIAFMDCDFHIDKEWTQKATQMTKEQMSRYLYTRTRSAEDALLFFDEALKSNLFTLLIADPWNNISGKTDMDKSADNFVGKTKTADRAVINNGFFRNRTYELENSKMSMIFCQHATEKIGGLGGHTFAGGSALRAQCELIIYISSHYTKDSPYQRILDDEKNPIITPIDLTVEKNKNKGNLKRTYTVFFHHELGFKHNFQYLAFLMNLGKLQSAGSFKYIDAYPFSSSEKFYYKDWERFFQNHQPQVMDLCNSLAEELMKGNGDDAEENQTNMDEECEQSSGHYNLFE